MQSSYEEEIHYTNLVNRTHSMQLDGSRRWMQRLAEEIILSNNHHEEVQQARIGYVVPEEE